MPKHGDSVAATVTQVTGHYTTVECEWAGSPYNMMHGNIDRIPTEYREVGQRVWLTWNALGSYGGPLFSGPVKDQPIDS